jgi:DNA invertase Pin-like site-specific DNA recombinase
MARGNHRLLFARAREALMKAALYARVSSRDQKTIPDQLRELRAYCYNKGWLIAGEFSEKESGSRDTRPTRYGLLQRAFKGEFDVILVWKLDRWSRSTLDALLTLSEIHSRGLAFVSATEGLDFTTPYGRAMAGLLAVFAQLERETTLERVRAGVARAKEKGVRFGRPATARRHRATVLELAASGMKPGRIARELGIGRSSVKRMLDEEIRRLAHG